jgi:DNA-binding PadR family transcriptional regulator
LIETHLALLLPGPRHGYEVKKAYDHWFPDAQPLAFGQVYATLGRLVRDGLAVVVETRADGARERTVYAVTEAGRRRLQDWLAEPAPPAAAGGEEIVRKTVVAVRTAPSAESVRAVVAGQRTAHLRRMRALQHDDDAAAGDVAVRLARRHLVLHLDADLRWLDEAVEVLASTATTGHPPVASSDHKEEGSR